jgi:SET domain-containing protein
MHGFYIKALKDIEAGEEITLSYGDHITNSSWLYQYGFVYQPNGSDEMILWLELTD